MLKDLLGCLQQSGNSIDNLVYLGAGTCPDFYKIQDLKPARIVLVEANQSNVEELKRCYGREENLEVLESLVVADGEEAEPELLVTNLLGYSSILEPSHLSKFYPNIRVVRRESKPAITLPEICDNLGIAGKGREMGVEDADVKRNVLIVDLPGYEAKLIASLSEAILSRFELILCRTAEEVVYKGAQPLPELETIFRRRHFVTEVVRELNYPFLVLCACPDKVSQMEASLESTKQQLKELRGALQSSQEGRQALALEHEQLIAESNSLQYELNNAKNGNKQLIQQLEVAQSELQESQGSLLTLTKDYEQLKSESSELRSELNEFEVSCEHSVRQLQEVRMELEDAQETGHKLALENERLQVEYAALQAEKDELGKSNQLYGKALLKTQTDLDDLREKHRNLKQAKAKQNGVIIHVARRLERASEQYIKLAEKYPELQELGETVLLPMTDAVTEGESK